MTTLDFGELGKYINSKLYNTLCEQTGIELLTQEHIDEINQYMSTHRNESGSEIRLPWEYGSFVTENGIEFINVSVYNAAYVNPEIDDTATRISIPFIIDKYNKVIYHVVNEPTSKKITFFDNKGGEIAISNKSKKVVNSNFTIPQNSISEINEILRD